MDGQPDGVGAGCGNPVASSRRDQQPVAGAEGKVFAVVEFKLGTAAGQHHPFVFGLIKPEIRGAGVTVGNDALNAQPGPAQQGLEVLFRASGGQRKEEILAGQLGAWGAWCPNGRMNEKRLRRDEISVGFWGSLLCPGAPLKPAPLTAWPMKLMPIIRRVVGGGQLKVGMHYIVHPYRDLDNDLPEMGAIATHVGSSGNTLIGGG